MQKIDIKNGGNIDFQGEWQHDGFYKLEADGGSIIVSNDVFIGWGTVISARDYIFIGKSVIIAEFCSIRDQNHSWDDFDKYIKHQGYNNAPIIIEDGCWLGAKSTILKGVRLGEGCIIGAGAVVTHDIPAYAIAVGVPAKVIGYRNKE